MHFVHTTNIQESIVNLHTMFTLQKSFHLHFHKLAHVNPHCGSTPMQRHEQIYILWTGFIFTYLFVCFFENEKDFLKMKKIFFPKDKAKTISLFTVASTYAFMYLSIIFFLTAINYFRILFSANENAPLERARVGIPTNDPAEHPAICRVLVISVIKLNNFLEFSRLNTRRPCGTPCNLQGFSYFRN